ncbi:hypothetical protein MK079_00555 [Candidatus Gracilibacteria bacterium]|nr:hypothetical protein [Candidatus Gracilibacteria bacterium]
MIQIEKHDSIHDIISKIKDCPKEYIILHFPFGHCVLHNATALKIIKKSSQGKEICIKTSDITAKKIGEKIGFHYRVSQSYMHDTPKSELSIKEYLKKSAIEYKDEFLSLIHKKTLISSKYSGHENGRITPFLVYLGVAMLLFIFIYYFAVNKTYVHITPEIHIKNKGKNFVFQEMAENEISHNINHIKMRKIQAPVSLKKTFTVQGVDTQSISRASGSVILYNHTDEAIPLLRNTRLETVDKKALFTIPDQISLPAAKQTDDGVIPSETRVYVQASIYNSIGNLVGTQGNLEAETLLVFPGFGGERENIYARVEKTLQGGTDNLIKKISRDDIERAKDSLEKELKKEAFDALKKAVEEQNEIGNITYEILGTGDITDYSNVEIQGEELIAIGEKSDTFELSGSITATSYIYNKEIVLSRLRNFISENTLDNVEEVLSVNEDSLRIAYIISREKNPLRVKATMQVEVFYTYNFLGRENYYLENFKNTIAGLSKSDAIKILLNNPKIHDVEIQTRPFFLENVSGIPNNIIFKVED